VLRFSPCKPLLLEAGSRGTRIVGNPEEGERRPLKPLSDNGWLRQYAEKT
jgi:hypothetical protein